MPLSQEQSGDQRGPPRRHAADAVPTVEVRPGRSLTAASREAAAHRPSSMLFHVIVHVIVLPLLWRVAHWGKAAAAVVAQRASSYSLTPRRS
jgi:hypothetical protein